MGIFGANGSKSKIFQVGESVATINGSNAVLLDVNCSVTRNVSPIPTLTDGIWWAAHPAMGTMSANTILTSDKKLVNRLSGNVCEKLGISFFMKNGCDAGSVHIDIKDGYCTQLGFNVSGQTGYIASNFAVTFSDCSIN